MTDFIKEKEMEIKVLNSSTQMSKKTRFSRKISVIKKLKKLLGWQYCLRHSLSLLQSRLKKNNKITELMFLFLFWF